jgi:hypothetical protein
MIAPCTNQHSGANELSDYEHATGRPNAQKPFEPKWKMEGPRLMRQRQRFSS